MKSFATFIALLAGLNVPTVVLTDSSEVASQLGTVIASEEFCDLKYNQDAVQKFIEQNVKADDMEFPENLAMAIRVRLSDNSDISSSAKTAHCAQIRRIAKSYDFVD